MADDFTEIQFNWLSQVARDATLPPAAARLAIILSRYVNRETGDAWPSIPTLAEALGTVENSVRKALKAMVAGGHLEIKAGGGRNTTNRYRWRVKAGLGEDKPCTPVKGNNDKPFTEMKCKEPKPCIGVKPLEQETLHGREENPSFLFTKPCTSVKGNPYKNPYKNPLKDNIAPPAKKSKPVSAEREVLEILATVLSPETCADLLEHRKAKRSKLTAGAAKGLVKEFTASGDPESAAREMLLRGWTGFKAEWLDKGRAKDTRRNPQPDGCDGKFLRLAVEQIGGNDD